MVLPNEDRTRAPSRFNVVFGVTGGIAAYKAVEIARTLTKSSANVDVVMTPAATRFVSPLTFQTISANPVSCEMFAPIVSFDMKHISLAKKADLFIIAPCTANTLAKIASGIADNLLTSAVLATSAKLLIAPAMNDGMYANDATAQNISILKKRGVYFVGPETGALANGDIGAGRMSEPCDIVTRALSLLSNHDDLKGRKILVTAGPTIEYLDPVRYISNKSSGKMGYAIAERAMARGAEVTLVTGPVHISPPPCVSVVCVETTMQLFKEVLKRCAEQDAIIQAAAPSDFRPSEVSDRKIKKREGLPMNLEIMENPDIAATFGARKRKGQVSVTFAAETENLIENSKAKMKRKNADIMVANDVLLEGAGFDVDTNVVTIIKKDGLKAYPLMTKRAIADVILSEVAALLN